MCPSSAMFSCWVRTVAQLLMAALAISVASGCSSAKKEGEPEQPESRNFAGQQIICAVPAGWDFADRWDLPLTEWQTRTGGDCKLVEFALSETTEIAQGTDSVDQLPTADVYLVPWTMISEVDARFGLANIPHDLQAEERLDWRDFPKGLRDIGLNIGSKPAIIPLSVPVLLCYYRADLLRAAGRQPPKTWDDYEDLLQSMSTWAPGKVAVEPWSGNWLAVTYLARAAAIAKHPDQYSFARDVSDGTPLISHSGFVRALERMQRARPQLTDDVFELTPKKCRQELLAGRAALGIAMESHDLEGNRGESMFERAENIELGIIALPGSPVSYNLSSRRFDRVMDRSRQNTLIGFAGFVLVVRSSDNIAAAWDLVESLTREDFTGNFPKPLGNSVRLSETAESAEGLTLAEQSAWRTAVFDSLNSSRISLALPMHKRQDYLQSLTSGLVSALKNEESAEKALQQVAAIWEKYEASNEALRSTQQKTYGRRLNVIRN